jgi:hypothetical protein
MIPMGMATAREMTVADVIKISVLRRRERSTSATGEPRATFHEKPKSPRKTP